MSNNQVITVEFFEVLKIKMLLEQLDKQEEKEGKLLSLLICPDDMAEYINLLEERISVSKTTDKEEHGCVTAALKRVKLYDKEDSNGVVLYKGKGLSVEFEPTKRLTQSLFLFDTKFYTEPIKELFGVEEILASGTVLGSYFGQITRDA